MIWLTNSFIPGPRGTFRKRSQAVVRQLYLCLSSLVWQMAFTPGSPAALILSTWKVKPRNVGLQWQFSTSHPIKPTRKYTRILPNAKTMKISRARFPLSLCFISVVLNGALKTSRKPAVNYKCLLLHEKKGSKPASCTHLNELLKTPLRSPLKEQKLLARKDRSSQKKIHTDSERVKQAFKRPSMSAFSGLLSSCLLSKSDPRNLENHQHCLSGKESVCNAGDVRVIGLIYGSERSPGGGHDNLLQYSCLGNSKDRGA